MTGVQIGNRIVNAPAGTQPIIPGADPNDAVRATAAITPAGVMWMYAGAAAPSGWLLCDGSSVLRTAYPSLFSAIGTTYGTVDGTHFTLPDTRGRAALGVGTGSGLSARALGASGGEELHTLTDTESGVPVHTHPGINDGGSFGLGITNLTLTAGVSGTYTRAAAPGIAISANSAASAANGHNTMQPWLAVNFIIKT